MPRASSNPDSFYEINVLKNGLLVLEALQDSTTMAIQTARIQLRTGLPYNACFRILKTLKLSGYVAEVDGGWKLTPKVARIAGKLMQGVF